MADSVEIPAPSTPADRSIDGERIKDMTYYNLLQVRGDATPVELKKAYRKAALLHHPDRGGDPERFQEIGLAFGVLNEPNARAFYDKEGIKTSGSGLGASGEGEMPDPGLMFSQMFGGITFEDWIGELSLGKDVSKVFASVSEEEKEQMKAEAASVTGGIPSSSSSAAAAVSASAVDQAQSTISHSIVNPVSVTEEKLAFGTAEKSTPITATSTSTATASASTFSSTAPSTATTPTPARSRPTPEERAEQLAESRRRDEEKRERIRVLAQKLIERVRPFVESSAPGAPDDPETMRFVKRMQEEVVDLSMASFGVELCHLIGTIYMSKANAYIRLHKSAASNLLGVPAWWNRVRDKGKMLKEGWSLLSVGLDIHTAMKDMQQRQEESSGELDEAEVKRMEEDMSGILLLVAWKGSRFELSSLLRQVVDLALSKDGGGSKGETDETRMNRAKGIMLCGAILKSVVPDETDSERRELEKMVAAADLKRKQKKSTTRPVPVPSVVKPTTAPAS